MLPPVESRTHYSPSTGQSLCVTVGVFVFMLGISLHYYPRRVVDYVGRRGYDFRVRLFVCLFVSLLSATSETNDPKVFKLGIVNALGIYSKWHGFGVKRSTQRSSSQRQ